MRGYPKYKINDKVYFIIEDKKYEGTIYIIDKFGTFDNPSDVSYDIMSEYDGKPCLFKHITEKKVKKMRHWKCEIKEVGSPHTVKPELWGDETMDEKYCIKFWGLKNPDVEWYKLEEVKDE